jgi:hypothetical protein
LIVGVANAMLQFPLPLELAVRIDGALSLPELASHEATLPAG